MGQRVVAGKGTSVEHRDRTCSTCRYAFVERGEDAAWRARQAQCRRYPPTGQAIDAWPVVTADAWCGEYAPRDTGAPAERDDWQGRTPGV